MGSNCNSMSSQQMQKGVNQDHSVSIHSNFKSGKIVYGIVDLLCESAAEDRLSSSVLCCWQAQ